MSGPPVASVTADLGIASRDLGAVGAVHEWLPAWAVEMFVVLTTLGDTWLLAMLAAVVYLAYDRRAGGFVIGSILLAFATTLTLKTWFALPRPPDELAHVVVTGYGFPSGHALGATVAWGALAVALGRISSARWRAAVAGVVVLAVAISRVIIGVHYLVDVVAGIAVGLAVLTIAVRWGREAPLTLFGLGGAVALVAVVASEGSWRALGLLGATVGAIAAWQVVEPADRPWGRRGVTATGCVGLVVAGTTVLADPIGARSFVAGALVTAAVFVGPAVRDRWMGQEPAEGRVHS